MTLEEWSERGALREGGQRSAECIPSFWRGQRKDALLASSAETLKKCQKPRGLKVSPGLRVDCSLDPAPPRCVLCGNNLDVLLFLSDRAVALLALGDLRACCVYRPKGEFPHAICSCHR